MTANNSTDFFSYIHNTKLYNKSPESGNKVCHFSRRWMLLLQFYDIFQWKSWRVLYNLAICIPPRHSFIFCCVWDGIKLEEECNFPIIWRTKLFAFAFIVSYCWTTSLSSMKTYLKRYMGQYLVIVIVEVVAFVSIRMNYIYSLSTTFSLPILLVRSVYKWNKGAACDSLFVNILTILDESAEICRWKIFYFSFPKFFDFRILIQIYKTIKVCLFCSGAKDL